MSNCPTITRLLSLAAQHRERGDVAAAGFLESLVATLVRPGGTACPCSDEPNNAPTPDEERQVVLGGQHLCASGCRTMVEFLLELFRVATTQMRIAMLNRLLRYRGLDPTLPGRVLDVFAAGKPFPPILTVVDGDNP